MSATRITRIHGKGIRGKTFSLDLTGRDIILGSNGQGKTTALETIDLAWQGYIYRLGKLNLSLLPLFAEGMDRIDIGVDIEQCGKVIAVRRVFDLTRDDDGPKVSHELTVKGLNGGKSGNTAKQAALLQAIGHAPVCLDLAELFSEGVTEQRRTLFSLMDGGAAGFSKAGVTARIAQMLLPAHIAIQPDRKAVAEAALAEILSAWGDTEDIQDGVTNALGWTEKAWTEAKKALKSAEAAVQAATQGILDSGVVPDPLATKAEIETVTTELRSIEDMLTVDAERQKTARERAEAIRKVEAAVAYLSKPEDGEDSTDAAARLTPFREQLMQIGDPDLDQVEAAEQHKEAALIEERRQESELAKVEKALRDLPTVEEVEFLRVKAAELADATPNAQHDATEASLTAEKKLATAVALEREKRGKAIDLDEKIEKLEKLTEQDCPTCLRLLDAETACRLMDSYRDQIDGIGVLASAHEAKEAAMQASAAAAAMRLMNSRLLDGIAIRERLAAKEEAFLRRPVLEVERSTLEQSKANATSLREKAASNLDDLRNRRMKAATIKLSIASCERIISAVSSTTARRTGALEARQTELAALKAADQSAPALQETEMLETRRKLLSEKLAALNLRREAELTAERHVTVQLDAARMRLAAEIRLETLTNAKTALGPNGLQGQIVKQLIAPTATAADALLSSVRPDLRLAVRLTDLRGRPAFDVGCPLENGGWISWHALSTGERALFGSALIRGFNHRFNPPLKILKVDCIEALDERNGTLFLDALGKMDDLGNIILAGVTFNGKIPDGWKVHRLGENNTQKE